MIRSQKRIAGKRHEQGYVLITLICFTAMLAIAATATLPGLIFELKRDQEEECIHRGVQYTRAIRQYAKKYGRYPNRIEDLENTSGIRFLRRRYKDPITGRDFKVLHMADVQLTYGAGSQALLEAHKNPGPSGDSPSNTNQGGDNQSGAPTQNVAPNVSPSPPSPGNADGSTTVSGDSGITPAGQASSSQNAPSPGLGSATTPGGSGPGGPGGQVLGGGAVVGVASVSKKKTIREFKQKNHYDQWQFYYDPSTDRGLPANTPSLPFQPPQGSVGAAGPGKSPNSDTPNSSQQPPAPLQ